MNQFEYKNITGEKWSVEKGDWISSQKFEGKKGKEFIKKINTYDIGFFIIIVGVVFAVTFLFTY